MRIIYADVQYDSPRSSAFRVLVLRDQNGTDLTRHVDPTKWYNSTLEISADLAKKLGGKVRVEID